MSIKQLKMQLKTLRSLDITMVHEIAHVIDCWLTFSELCGNKIIYNQPVTCLVILQTGYPNILFLFSKTRTYFPTFYIVIFSLFNDLRWEMIVCFAHIIWIIYYHCLNFLFISWLSKTFEIAKNYISIWSNVLSCIFSCFIDI